MPIDPDSPPSKEPSEIIAGLNIKWTKSLSGFLPEDSWILTYSLLKEGTRIEIIATDNGDSTHLVNVQAATTKDYTVGTYEVIGHVTKSLDKFEVFRGTMKVTADPTSGSGADLRSDNKKLLDALEATLLGRASHEEEEYSIEGRSLKRMSIDELITTRDKIKADYLAEVRRAEIKNGCANKTKILARFKRP